MARRKADKTIASRPTPAMPLSVPQYLTKAELARQHIHGMILSGIARPGQHITAREVCEALGMSETPVREAIRALATEGWLDMHAHFGVVVAAIDTQNFSELYTLRGVLGALAIELGAASYDAAMLERLDSILDRSEACAAAGDFPGYGLLNREFHLVLCDTPHTQWTLKLQSSLAEQTEAATHGFAAVPGRLAQSLAEHRAIVAAIRAGDIAGAAALMRAHEQAAGVAMIARVKAAG